MQWPINVINVNGKLQICWNWKACVLFTLFVALLVQQICIQCIHLLAEMYLCLLFCCIVTSFLGDWICIVMQMMCICTSVFCMSPCQSFHPVNYSISFSFYSIPSAPAVTLTPSLVPPLPDSVASSHSFFYLHISSLTLVSCGLHPTPCLLCLHVLLLIPLNPCDAFLVHWTQTLGCTL